MMRLKKFWTLLRWIVRVVTILYYIFKSKFNIIFIRKKPDAYIYISHRSSKWLVGDSALKDISAYKALCFLGYTPVFINKIDLLTQYKVGIFNAHPYLVSSELSERASALCSEWGVVTQNTEIAIPEPKELLYWENKSFMTKKFLDSGINIPKTMVLSNANSINEVVKEFNYPFLIKDQNGYSSNGIELISSFHDISNRQLNEGDLVQELINIRRDIRISVIDGKVIGHYWRINNRDTWAPTATSYGSSVDFFTLPAKVIDMAFEIYQKLGVRSFGADICFKDDDLNNDPLLLEISPVYQINPVPSNAFSR